LENVMDFPRRLIDHCRNLRRGRLAAAAVMVP
jgi:hypothetical protein